MAKMENIRNLQVIDNKEDKFFYFPMISMPCTGSGYEFDSTAIAKPLKTRGLAIFLSSNFPPHFPHICKNSCKGDQFSPPEKHELGMNVRFIARMKSVL